jgi:hypothetical protein
MRVYLSKTKKVSVASFAEASAAVRNHIDNNDLGAGCGSSLKAFTGGRIVSDLGNDLGRISYNVRVWTEQWHHHGLCRNVLYTDGVKYLGDKAGAYWLIDKIATMQIDRKIGEEQFQVWRLVVKDGRATLTCDDGDRIGIGDSKPVVLHSEEISFTDFPLDKIELWVEGGVILLPSEH